MATMTKKKKVLKIKRGKAEGGKVDRFMPTTEIHADKPGTKRDPDEPTIEMGRSGQEDKTANVTMTVEEMHNKLVKDGLTSLADALRTAPKFNQMKNVKVLWVINPQGDVDRAVDPDTGKSLEGLLGAPPATAGGTEKKMRSHFP